MESHLTLFEMIGEVARRRYQLAERFYSRIGLNHTEARLIMILHHENNVCTQEKLSNSLNVDRSNAGRGLKRLERDGYVERRKGGDDKRTKIVQITEKGQRAVSEIVKLRKEMSKSFLGKLNEEEVEAVVSLLRKALAERDS